MALGIWLALGAMICLGISDIVYKRGAAARVKPHHFLAAQAWCFAPGVALYGLATGTLELKPYMLWGCGAGFFAFIALINFAGSLATGSVSLIAPIFRMSFTVTTALAVLLLGEPFGIWKITGLACALLAVWLLLGGETRPVSVSGAARTALVQALVAMAAMGVANFLYKIGAASGGTPATFIAGQAAALLPLAAAYAWHKDRTSLPPRAAWAHAGAAAAFLLGLILLFESLTHGEASVMVPVSQMGFVVTAAYGVLFLREPVTARKAGGLLLAFGALFSLALA
jgi:drug/metabolite transporter (DMT)-like permease